MTGESASNHGTKLGLLTAPLLVALALSGCSRSNAVGQGPQGDGVERRGQADGSGSSRPADKLASNWPGWRGPERNGTLATDQLPAKLPGEIRPAWQQPLETGWSSPVIFDNRLFVTDRQGNTERLLAFDAQSGEPLWTVSNFVDFDPHDVGRRHGNGPKSTVAADANQVYSLGIAGWLQGVNSRTGSVVWKVNLPEQFAERIPLPEGKAYVDGTENVIVPVGQGQGGAVPLFGYTGSLLLTDGLVILSVGGARGGTVMAFDARDGRVAWSSLDEHLSYSSPVVADLSDIRQVVIMTGPRVVGLRLTDGKLLWSYPFQIQYDESISTPTVAGNRVLITGDSRPLTALEIPRGLTAESPISLRPAWENWDLSSYLSSMVADDRHVYGMGDDGQFVCARLSDGTTVWSGGNHGTYCSPILAGKRLFGLNEDGELAVLDAQAGAYRELAVLRLVDEATWTMPAIVGHRIYVRSQSAISAFEIGR